MYAEYEENFGMIRNSMRIYEKLIGKLEGKERYQVINVFLFKSV